MALALRVGRDRAWQLLGAPGRAAPSARPWAWGASFALAARPTALIVELFLSALAAAEAHESEHEPPRHTAGLVKLPQLLGAGPCTEHQPSPVPLYSTPRVSARVGEIRVTKRSLLFQKADAVHPRFLRSSRVKPVVCFRHWSSLTKRRRPLPFPGRDPGAKSTSDLAPPGFETAVPRAFSPQQISSPIARSTCGAMRLRTCAFHRVARSWKCQRPGELHSRSRQSSYAFESPMASCGCSCPCPRLTRAATRHHRAVSNGSGCRCTAPQAKPKSGFTRAAVEMTLQEPANRARPKRSSGVSRRGSAMSASPGAGKAGRVSGRTWQVAGGRANGADASPDMHTAVDKASIGDGVRPAVRTDIAALGISAARAAWPRCPPDAVRSETARG